MENENSPRPEKKKRRILPAILLALCFFASAAAGALLASSGLFDLDLKKDPIQQIDRINFDTELIKAHDKTTVLIMGVDVRHDDAGRSDTMMVATIDPKLDSASLLSVPRDTRVRIYGYGYDKINAAFAYGGEPLAERTVENFLGINIDHYVIVDVNSFVKIIDAIGGIDIDVEKRMRYEDPWDDNGGLVINLYPGVQHMDGKTAVTYVRYRDSEGDIGRIKRQQKFMAACMEKVMSPSFIPRIPAVLREVVDAVDTDMTTRQLMELAGSLKSAQQHGLETDMVPGYPLYIEDISYWIPDIEELQYAMATGLGVNVDSRLKSRVKKIANEYSESIPSNVRNSYRPNDEENISPRSTYSNENNSGRNDEKISNHSTYNEDTNSSRSTYNEDTNSSYSTYNEDLNSSRSTYNEDTNSNYSTYNEDTNSNYSTYDEDTNSNPPTYDEDANSRYSTYDEEVYTPSRPTYAEYSPPVENIRIPDYDYYDDVPTRDGDTYKER